MTKTVMGNTEASHALHHLLKLNISAAYAHPPYKCECDNLWR